MPEGAHEMIWRIVLDPRIPDGLSDIRASWCLDDLLHAHALLDQLDAIDARRQLTSEARHG